MLSDLGQDVVEAHSGGEALLPILIASGCEEAALEVVIPDWVVTPL